ncbi:MAG: apolipoprotein N-acyltransferase [Bacteroidales bacterium]|nr:apolipoprotein N-acyltransferase [Bacteroidales bacterium]
MKSRKSVHIYILGWILISSLLLSLPFLVDHLGFLALFGMVPLFFIEDICRKHDVKGATWYYYLLFVVWNTITTYWVSYATLPGGIAAILLNAFQMSLVFWFYRLFKRQILKRDGASKESFIPYLFFIVTWLGWEHYYFDAEVSWPWLVLGNAFAGSIKSVQWYEYTGTLGGSLWILLSNVLLYRIIVKEAGRDKDAGESKYQRRQRYALYGGYASLIILPFVISFVMFSSYEEKKDPCEFVLLQPNIEPYQDKFNTLTRDEQDDILFRLAERGVTPQTSFVVAPETFTWFINEDAPYTCPTIRRMGAFVKKYPQTNFITGAVTMRQYVTRNAPSLTAKKGRGYWYDTFNASVMMDSTGQCDFFHKSKLVVLTEFIPYPKLLAPINKLAIELGGATGSYGTQPEITIFEGSDGTKIGTAICYESVYGDYYRDYILKGAQVMSIITNDGWWSNTPGYRQHLRYASLRAIETRRSIARSANTGISAFINQRGERVAELGWWHEDCLTGSINLNNELTFFVRHGDFIGRISTFMFTLLALLYFTIAVTKRAKKK